ncbi:MAG: hypothetical protein QM235_14310 [Pseudomonadota bacterium]|nr:hypothetical protein [Pseudomonadota bacterium]
MSGVARQAQTIPLITGDINLSWNLIASARAVFFIKVLPIETAKGRWAADKATKKRGWLLQTTH